MKICRHFHVSLFTATLFIEFSFPTIVLTLNNSISISGMHHLTFLFMPLYFELQLISSFIKQFIFFVLNLHTTKQTHSNVKNFFFIRSKNWDFFFGKNVVFVVKNIKRNHLLYLTSIAKIILSAMTYKRK